MGVVSAGSLRLYGFAEERLIRVMKTSLSPGIRLPAEFRQIALQ